MEDAPKPQVDLRWLVPMRSRIQSLCLEVYNYEVSLTGIERERVWPLCGYLIGAIFSFWRSVFLSLPTRQNEEMYAGGRNLLRTVLETNSIGFAQDKANSQWMAGYYHNNVILRLSDLLANPEARSIIENVIPENLEETTLGWYRPERQLEFGRLSPQEQCEHAFEAVEQVFHLLKKSGGYD